MARGDSWLAVRRHLASLDTASLGKKKDKKPLASMRCHSTTYEPASHTTEFGKNRRRNAPRRLDPLAPPNFAQIVCNRHPACLSADCVQPAPRLPPPSDNELCRPRPRGPLTPCRGLPHPRAGEAMGSRRLLQVGRSWGQGHSS
jgi:hypothetical protein